MRWVSFGVTMAGGEEKRPSLRCWDRHHLHPRVCDPGRWRKASLLPHRTGRRTKSPHLGETLQRRFPLPPTSAHWTETCRLRPLPLQPSLATTTPLSCASPSASTTIGAPLLRIYVFALSFGSQESPEIACQCQTREILQRILSGKALRARPRLSSVPWHNIPA